MTNYAVPEDQRWAAEQAEMRQQIRTLQTQVAQLTGGTVAGLSSAHPAHPYTGMPIYETDTGLTAYWSGTAWVYPTQAIRTQTLAGPTASVTFSGLPSVFNFLRLEWRVHTDAGGATDLQMRVDGSSSALYLWAKNEAASAVQADFHAGAAATFMKIGAVSATTASYFSSGSLSIAGWASSTGYLSASGTSTLFDSNTVDYVGAYGGLYAATGPHTSLTIYPAANNFVAGSQFVLVGVG